MTDRRTVLTAGAAMLAAGALPSAVRAQGAWPTKPIRVVLGSPPGASTDVAARIAADVLSRELGQPAVPVNQPGANGTISAKNVARSAPDGYTLLSYYADQMQVAPLVFKDKPYDPIDDFEHIAPVVRSGAFIIAVPPSSPVKNWDDFVKHAKSTKKQLSYGTWGIGSSAHLGFEVLNEKLGTQMVHIPYQGGGPSYQAAMAGDIDVVSGTSFVELLKAGKLRPIAIGGTQRSKDFPQLPTLAELGYGDLIFSAVYYAIAAPKGTPKDVQDKIRAALAKGLKDPGMVSRAAAIATEPFDATPEQIVETIRKTRDAYKPIVARLGIAQ